uniref:Radical SAM superfamily enzyme YgiQ, UPF0313 family n=1 Tax=Candidatus Kentrum sp. MB TaxID=2138164 RepID=A0A450XEW2_9GAMM|nr:MAG: Radical SAM superfamily enzyme YgiQ, UPF0313 family [Candidatus Kentron sp. MB]VFK30207.1 MAG: Radical SAM superfamily enzyme YgiQ, UPF0313 family [Candidatus Kentron sp. MB]VFK75137.1 MAG: Radical SAM superfamily enzyme YgiQ, UPF0313 family [Candidatus Kentron sp. MB]
MKEFVHIKNPRILVVHPAHRPTSQTRYFPIGLGYVLSAIKKTGIKFTLLDIDANRQSDAEVRKLMEDNPFDIMMIGALITAYKFVKKFCRMAREVNPDSIIIAGNSVASSIPEHLLKNNDVDIAVIGEGDITTVELIEGISKGINISTIAGIYYIADGKVKSTPDRAIIKNIDSIPELDWDIFDINKYIEGASCSVPEIPQLPKEKIRAFVINTARGCPYKCTFCYHVFIKNKYRYRSTDSIIAEIRRMQEKYGINYIFFFDELTFYSVKQATAFVDKVLESGLQFYWEADVRSNLFRDKDLPMLKRMKESGCLALGYSLESADPTILQSMKKKLKVEDFTNQKLVLDKAGIHTNTSLVFGYPEETEETIKKTLDLCYDLNVYPSSGFLLPQPSTPMYDFAKAHGFIEDEEEFLLGLGDRQDLRFNLTAMTDEVFQQTVEEGLVRISEKLKFNFDKEKLLKTGNQHNRIT